MGQYTSYYIYERYEKRGEQDWIPCYPNTYSISGDATNPMSLVVKSENDTQCGYTPTPTEPIYRWVNLDPSTDYYCDGVAKYYKQQRQVSYDGGTTWSNLNEYQRGSQYEASSSDCGGGTTMYKWVNLDPSTDYYCDECNTEETWLPTYRWALYEGHYICLGVDKYAAEVKQVSNNGGKTWENITPLETRVTNILVQSDTSDCGGSIEPVNNYLIITRYNQQFVTGISCTSDGVLSRDVILKAYLGNWAAQTISFGECLTEIGPNTLGGFLNESIRGINFYTKIPPLLNEPTLGALHYVTDNTGGYPLDKPSNIYVPKESLRLYKIAPSWKDLKDRLVGKT